MGLVLLGTFISLMQYGWTARQCFEYFRFYRHDTLLLKTWVIVVFVLETFHSILSMHICYSTLVTNFFSPQNLISGRSWSSSAYGITTGFVVIASQLYFIRRAWLCTYTPDLLVEHPNDFMGCGFRVLVIIAAISAVLFNLGTSIAASVISIVDMEQNGFVDRHLVWLSTLGNGSNVLADVLLTITLAVSLRRSRTGLERTDSLIDKIVLYAITTGLLTTVFNILSFIFALVLPQTYMFILFSMIATKLYATSMLAALNSRRALALHLGGRIPTSFELSPIDFRRRTSGDLLSLGVLRSGRACGSRPVLSDERDALAGPKTDSTRTATDDGASTPARTVAAGGRSWHDVEDAERRHRRAQDDDGG
ncbi:uncharacterized protein BXZ73DRAFT_99229 [Epithele typhae]|uniref:uncharacterized protein n=1 Tax=Epithele typhae TaxID=378194 RepID=UPI0020082565|nr:uncharacterized protein BXZ73DRAFT_99229 [Epithele typhae]KAH9939613.1 hypothetical protein BXZ73DRAFT_99229 [Epithele typhae]